MTVQPSVSASQMPVPTVSVLLAVHNAAPYLAATLDSVLQQTLASFELIIIDDGSQDGSQAILERYAAQDRRIRLTCRENRGIATTRNQLVAMARSELIAILDADDLALPERLQQQFDFLQTHPEVVWVGGAFQLIDERGRLLTTIRMATDNDQIQRLLLDGHTSFLHPTAMIRKAAILQVGGYDDSFVAGSDLDLWLKLTEIGAVANLPQPVLQYRIHSHSISSRSQTNQWANAARAFDQSWQRRGLVRQFEVTGCRWRPQASRASQWTFMVKYGWWAFNSRQRGTAIHYGQRACWLRPWSLASWKLLICSMVKPLPAGQPDESSSDSPAKPTDQLATAGIRADAGS